MVENDDEDYFIFDESIKKVIALFFRDSHVAETVKTKPHQFIMALGTGDRNVGIFPPSGVLPFEKFARLISPFCFISMKIEEVYFIF